MENKVVNLQIKTELGNTKKDFDSLKKGITDSKSAAVDLNKTVEETGKKGNVFSKLTSGLGNLIPGFKGASAAGEGVVKTMWSIVANPIGAVIAAIVLGVTLLYKAFASTKEGGEKMEQVMAGISATVDVLRDRVLKAGGAIAKFLTGDFKGAFEDAKATVSGIGSEIEGEFKQAANATKFLQEVTDAVRDLGVSRAKLNRDLARSKEIIADENASYAEKKKAINDVRVAEEKQTSAELKNAQKKVDSIKSLNKLSDTSKDDLQKLADAESQLFALQQKSAEDKRAIRKTDIKADKEENDRLKAISDERKAAAKIISDAEAVKKKEIAAEDKKIKDEIAAAEKKSLTDAQAIKTALEQSQETPAQKENREYLEKKLVLEANHLDTELLTQIHTDNLNKIILDSYAKDADAAIAATAQNKANAAAQESIDKKLADSKIENLARGSAMLSNISDLIGKNTAAGKVAAVAAATIDTYAAAQAAFKNAQANPISILGPAYPYISAGLAIAGGLKNVKSILAVKTPNGGGGGGSVPSDRSIGSGPSAPSFNVVGASQTNQLAQSIGQQQNQPIRTYVVSSDVSTAQSLDRNIITSASIG